MIEDLLIQPADEPGRAVAVVRGGEVVARHCVGLASVEHQVPIGPATRFHIVSMSKTFMAATVLILAARGALRLDDPVRRHIPELPAEIDRDGVVTIRHLLSLTSGLRDVLEIERLRGVWRPSPSRVQDLLALACRQAALSAPAGAQYIYTNVNHVLLDEIAARASGMPADEFRRQAIYGPLGLTATTARPHDGIVLPDLADPYVPDGAGGWSRATHLLGIAGDVLTSTLDDLIRWLQALRSGSIGGVPVTAAMAERARLRDGRAIHYGLGLAVRRYRGLAVLCHSGSQPSYKAHIAYVPERDLALAILSNREDTRPSALAAAMMERLIDDFPAPHPAASARQRLEAAAFTAAQRAAIAGTYVDTDTGEWVTLAFDEQGVLCGETLGDPFFLYHDPGGVFRDGDDYRANFPAELTFAFGPGNAVFCRLHLAGQTMHLRKCEPPSYGPDELAAFAGRYESAEIDSRHDVHITDAGLVINYGLGSDGSLRFAMEPIAPDIFLVQPRAPGIAYRHVFRFERDAAGNVVAAVVTMERLKGVGLSRV